MSNEKQPKNANQFLKDREQAKNGTVVVSDIDILKAEKQLLLEKVQQLEISNRELHYRLDKIATITAEAKEQAQSLIELNKELTAENSKLIELGDFNDDCITGLTEYIADLQDIQFKWWYRMFRGMGL